MSLNKIYDGEKNISTLLDESRFLPMDKEALKKRGWDYCDFIIVSGDAYVDHCSFGTAVIARLLESQGFKVGIIAQPNCNDFATFEVLGRPKLAFLVNAGNVDSMVANYSVNKRPRKMDYYSPGGQAGLRPDRAVIVYCGILKRLFKGVPIIIGGIEASLRRFSHYDFWSDKIRRSILLDSKADILIYGMGERAITEVAKNLSQGVRADEIYFVEGTLVRLPYEKIPKNAIEIPNYQMVIADKNQFAIAFKKQHENTDPILATALFEKIENSKKVLFQNPPAKILTQEELDQIYQLPYVRWYHPKYHSQGGVPAIKEVLFSLTSVRGCFGNCSFCAITFHQGRSIVSRSHKSILSEAALLTKHPAFKGIIHDVGGPTGNFRRPPCDKQNSAGCCKNRECLGFEACKNLKVDHSDYLSLLKKIRCLEGVKNVFIRSGIRYDYLLLDKDKSFFEELVKYHVSGQLKVAPEAIEDKVLKIMNKPSISLYETFCKTFFEMTKAIEKKQYVIPYLMSSHPGSTLDSAIKTALFLKKSGFIPDQVQDFYPTPGTLSTAIYYLGFHPITGEKIYCAKGEKEKRLQRALLHFHKPENYYLVKEALERAGKKELIGKGKNALISPYPQKNMIKIKHG